VLGEAQYDRWYIFCRDYVWQVGLEDRAGELVRPEGVEDVAPGSAHGIRQRVALSFEEVQHLESRSALGADVRSDAVPRDEYGLGNAAGEREDGNFVTSPVEFPCQE
jgi:hypothetical protein